MSQIILDITKISRCSSQYRNENLSLLGLGATHASYLIEICACPGISQDQLAQRIFINKSNIARQAACLEKDGFILRKPSPSDKRVLELYPTEKTLLLMPRLNAILGYWEQCLTEDFNEEELALIAKLLSRMTEKASVWMEAH